jgi:hypothetical protein
MLKKEGPKLDLTNRWVAMAARSAMELFKNGAVAKTKKCLFSVQKVNNSNSSVETIAIPFAACGLNLTRRHQAESVKV